MKMEKMKKATNKKLRRLTLTATTAASLLVGNTYDSVEEILSHEGTVDSVIDKYSQSRNKPTVKEKLRMWFDRLPFAVRLLVITPLYVIGWLMMLVLTPLWDHLLSGILAKVGYWLVVLLIILVILAVMKAVLLPDVPLKELFTRKNLLIIAGSVTALALLDELLTRTTPGYVRIGPFVRYAAILLIVSIFISVFYRKHQKKTVTASSGLLEFSVTD